MIQIAGVGAMPCKELKTTMVAAEVFKKTDIGELLRSPITKKWFALVEDQALSKVWASSPRLQGVSAEDIQKEKIWLLKEAKRIKDCRERPAPVRAAASIIMKSLCCTDPPCMHEVFVPVKVPVIVKDPAQEEGCETPGYVGPVGGDESYGTEFHSSERVDFNFNN